MSASFEEIGRAFVKQYYKIFDSDRQQLSSFYCDESMLTFEGKHYHGTTNIIKQLTNGLSFETVEHNVDNMYIDCQPSTTNGIFIMVSGNIIANKNSDQPIKFRQMFHLTSPGKNQWFLTNDVFRLVN
ncbi:hypothetical protein P9112_012757 [Eukaryota sp. TZLM1-RC]